MKKIIILITLLLVVTPFTSVSFGHDKDIPIFYSVIIEDTSTVVQIIDNLGSAFK